MAKTAPDAPTDQPSRPPSARLAAEPGQAAEKVNQQIARPPKEQFDILADDKEGVDVEENVTEAAMQEHRRQQAVDLAMGGDQLGYQRAPQQQLQLELPR